ncbi:GntR family transcriptional regulator [candidate division KSB1 bacterium]|nr:GntR family transcriptional regulator [candidate division KSB1 bacterium]
MEFIGTQPIYLQIVDLIAENILSRKWVEGERLASVRELAIQIEVNPNTVLRSFTYLQNRNVIFNKRGIGYFVAESAYEVLLNIKRTEFIKKNAPQFFRTMDLLDIKISELNRLYTLYKKEHHS